ncbi:hypothetical protein MRX96_026185 [Rhipicephalus microplus]
MSVTTLSRCTLLVLVLLWCDVSAGPGLDPKFLMELASHFDTSVLTQSCRKVFSKCKARIIPLVLQLESLLQKAPGLLDVECVQKELAKGFPRFDIECVMSDDYREAMECMEDPKVLTLLQERATTSRLMTPSVWGAKVQ